MATTEASSLPIPPVDRPILCSPYAPPSRHWNYNRVTGEAQILAQRRPARYWYKTKDDAKGQLALELSEGQDDLHTVNQLREDVARWRDLGYEGATPVTKELLAWWARADRGRRLFFCQLEAAQTIIYLVEILRSGKRPRFNPLFPLGDLAKLVDPPGDPALLPLDSPTQRCKH